ncbi:MAG: CRISPR-associated endonuclease Cas1 [Sulfolobales archaeon]|nr:CRISPR-associated endonuclease Cas1 [Sulfolobales archaeon]MDW8082548.1 CRISPR-associated endonuclease Cas1 [Sulfolobales archaeon]
MKILVVSGYGVKISVKKDSIVLKTREGTSNISLSEVDCVTVTTSGVSITSKAIRYFTKLGVMLVLLDSRGMPAAVLHHPFTTRTVSTRRAQYEALHSGRAEEVVKAVAVSKLGNQAGLLRKLRRELRVSELAEVEQKILELASSVAKIKNKTLSELRTEVINTEATSARHYWSALASVLPKDLGFDGRDQEGCDVVNCALNYGYGILYSAIWRYLSIHGLDPYAGFLHADRSGKPVLTFDVVEVFRVPAVDFPVVRALRQGVKLEVRNCLLDRESRARVVSLAARAMREKYSAYGEVRELESWVSNFTSSLASYLRGEVQLKPLVFRW